MAISLDEANGIVAGAIAKASELNIKINVAVCAGGRLFHAGGRLRPLASFRPPPNVAFNRMDGAIWAGVYGSQGKAVAAAAFGRTSGALQAGASTPIIAGILAAEGGHGIPSQGAVPIVRDGVVEGACGVGGGTSQEDEDCAAAGVDTLG